MLTLSGLTYPEVSSKVYHVCFCQLGSSISLPWVIYFEAFSLHVLSSFSCIPVICPKLVLFLTPLQFVYLFCNLSKCILLFFSCMCNFKFIYFSFISRCSRSVKLSTRIWIVRWLLERTPCFNVSSRNFLGRTDESNRTCHFGQCPGPKFKPASPEYDRASDYFLLNFIDFYRNRLTGLSAPSHHDSKKIYLILLGVTSLKSTVSIPVGITEFLN